MESQKDKPHDIDPEVDGRVEDVQQQAEKGDNEKTESEPEVAEAEVAVEGSVEEEITAPSQDTQQEEPTEDASDTASDEESPVTEDQPEVPTITEEVAQEGAGTNEEETIEVEAPSAVEEEPIQPSEAGADEAPIIEATTERQEIPESADALPPAPVQVTSDSTAPQDEVPIPEEQPEEESTASKLDTQEVEEDTTDADAASKEKATEGEPKEVQGQTAAHDRDVEHDHHPHHHDEHHDDHEDAIDYEHLGKDQIEALLAEISRDEDVRRIDRHLRPIKARFDELHGAERQEALDKFLAEGFEEGDFEYREGDQSQKIHAYLELLRDKRQKFYADRERQKEDNLKRKEEILEKIRELIDGEESDISIKGVKELQEEWKSIGPVPGQHNKTLWANYNALLDRFYDARSIYFELKDLDRKKNLKLKLDICERAEALDKMDNIKDAVVQLNELHEEFKHVGPIPREEQETVWQRFKSASDKIYVKRKDFVDELKKSLHENFEKKMTLADETDKFTSFDSDRISEWNKKTKEIQELQRRWEAVGGVPRDKAKQVNKKFWGGFKQFFAHKSAFFKRFEAQREDNLKKKQELVQRAEEMKESADWQSTTEQFKRLQAEWKEIGPVPEKFRNSIYEEFKAACDHFFDRRRDQNKEQNQEYEENYKQKQVICDSIAQLAKTEELDQDLLYDLIDQYNSIGFVPRNVMRKIQDRFNQATAQVINSPSLNDEDRNELKMNIEVSRLKGGPHANRKLFRKENSLKRKIDNLQNDINTWKTNMEFFASSKAADQLKKDFEVKIEQAQEELKTLRKELRLLND